MSTHTGEGSDREQRAVPGQKEGEGKEGQGFDIVGRVAQLNTLVSECAVHGQSLVDFERLLQDRKKALDMREARLTESMDSFKKDRDAKFGEYEVSLKDREKQVARREDGVSGIRQLAAKRSAETLAAKEATAKAAGAERKAKIEAAVSLKERENVEGMITSMLGDKNALKEQVAGLEKQVAELEAKLEAESEIAKDKAQPDTQSVDPKLAIAELVTSKGEGSEAPVNEAVQQG